MTVKNKARTIIVLFLFTFSLAAISFADQVKRSSFLVEKLSCGSCLSSIEQELKALDGTLGMEGDIRLGMVVVDHQTRLSEEEIATIHERYHGWVAGIILQAQSETIVHHNNGENDSTPEAIFSFLYQEVFKLLAENEQQILLQAALLPQISPTVIKSLTMDMESGSFLQKFYKNGYFITLHSEKENLYQFHPMFREFLLAKGEELFSAERHHRLQSQCAELLMAQGLPDEAAELLKDSQNWSGLTEFIHAHGQRLIMQGRYRNLLRLIESLPEKNRYNPWMLFWTGSALLHTDATAAQNNFEEALLLFEKQDQLEGICVCWAGLVESILFTWDDPRVLDGWIAWMEKLLTEKSLEDLPPEIMGRVTFAMFSALAHRCPQHPSMEMWEKQVAIMTETIPDVNQRVVVTSHYLYYQIWLGRFTEVKAVIERFRNSSFLNALAPLNLLFWLQLETTFFWLTGQLKSCDATVKEALKLTDKTGIHILKFQLLIQSAYLSFESDSAKKRSQALKKVLDSMENTGRLFQGHFYYAAALNALHDKNPESAFVHIQKSYDQTIDSDSPFPKALSTIAMVRILIELGRFDETGPYIQQADKIAAGMKSRFLSYSLSFAQAELAFAQDRVKNGLAFLRAALEAGKKMNIYYLDWWRPDIMTNLFMKALEHDIEVEYVQEYIRRRGLIPATPPLHLHNWPWQIRIFTLGRFTIVINEKPLKLTGKGQKKTIELLKALIAKGGREVHEEKLSEILWPDADGDAAHSAFTSTLYRLRKILPAETLTVNDSKLSLNDRRCWLDTWALERQLSDVEQSLTNDSDLKGEGLEKVQKAFDLYNGPLFTREAQESWIIAPRERIVLRLLRVIEKLVALYRESEDCLKVISLYEKALELDPLSEEYYRGLMQCFSTNGDRPKALSVYTRCKDQLNAAFGIEPSKETQALYQQILS